MTTTSSNEKITFISAGAGSGKTHRLTELLHRELASGAVRPGGVIATTFTKKAASELRERVRGHLLGQGAFDLANAMGEARIGTVNSVCGQLLERFAFEAGMSPQQQVVEEQQGRILLNRAIDAALDGEAMRAIQTVARRLCLIADKSRRITEDWRKDLKSIVDQIRANGIELEHLPEFAVRNADALLAHFPKPTQEDLSAALLKEIHAVLPALTSAAQASGRDNSAQYLDVLRDLERGLSRGTYEWAGWIRLANKAPEAGLKSMVEPITRLAGRAAEHRLLHADIRDYLTQLFSLAGKALAIYASMKREQGLVDFADQEYLLLKLIEHPEVAAVLSDELDLLMVDEFQDTSPIQLALFLRLARFARKVYWVGDIKQAIYGFRGSDTELMRALLAELPALGGTKQVLDKSWRSRPELVAIVNGIFAPAFANTLDAKDVELSAQRERILTDAALANWILHGKNIGEEANALALGVRKLVDSGYPVLDKGATTPRPVRLGDIAVLCRTNENVALIASALTSSGIPAATSQAGLLRTPEATLAMACLRRLNDPADTIATAEIVSLSDCAEAETWIADRLRYLAAGGDRDTWLEVPHGDGVAHSTHPLVVRLAELRANLSQLAPKESLETVIAACDLPAIVLRWCRSADEARSRLANLEALLEIAARYEDLCRTGQHAASISGLLLFLSEQADADADFLAEPAIDAVKLMTHHAAKGLEWPVVILMDLADKVRDRLWSITAQADSAFDVAQPLKDRFIRFWPYPFGAQSKINAVDVIESSPEAQRFRDAAIEEGKRLLYVSMTRARDLMVLVRSSRKLTGEWLDGVAAPWLLPSEDCEYVVLPDGSQHAATRWEFGLEDKVELSREAEGQTLHWFATPESVPTRLPLAATASSSSSSKASVIETCLIGQRIVVKSGTDMSTLGQAVHAAIAYGLNFPAGAIPTPHVDALLARFGIAECIASSALIAQIEALREWIASRWPDAKALTEYPAQHVLESGQVLNGRLDLLLDLGDRWIIIDHKSSQASRSEWEQIADVYCGQLRAYAQAVTMASGKPVGEMWIVLPVAGGAVRLG